MQVPCLLEDDGCLGPDDISNDGHCFGRGQLSEDRPVNSKELECHCHRDVPASMHCAGGCQCMRSAELWLCILNRYVRHLFCPRALKGTRYFVRFTSCY